MFLFSKAQTGNYLTGVTLFEETFISEYRHIIASDLAQTHLVHLHFHHSSTDADSVHYCNDYTFHVLHFLFLHVDPGLHGLLVHHHIPYHPIPPVAGILPLAAYTFGSGSGSGYTAYSPDVDYGADAVDV